MKRLLRALGVGAALLIPVAGLSIISSGVAGATTYPLSFEAHFTFTGPTIHVGSTCPQTTIVLLFMTTEYNNQTMYQILCTSTGTVGHGVPATGTDHLLITPTGFLLTATWTTIMWKPYTPTAHTGVSFKLTFGTTTCTISFPSSVTFAQTGRTATVYKVTHVSTATTTISPSTGVCANLAGVLHTPTATFSGTITLL